MTTDKGGEGKVRVRAEQVLRAEGTVWRYDVGDDHGLTGIRALEALETLGFTSVVGARGILRAAEELTPREFIL